MLPVGGGSTHGLDIYWEVQLLTDEFVDQELEGPTGRFREVDFYTVDILVKCGQCDRKYSAGKPKIGSRFRCSCGEVLQVQQPKSHTEKA